MKRQNIQERVAGVIESRREQLKKEINDWEEKLRDTELYWGLGGPYQRQAEALERRKAELEELEDFARQQGYIKRHQPARMHVLYCRECGNIVMSLHTPGGNWHECPSCKKMIYEDNPKMKHFNIEDEGQGWLQLIHEGIERQ